jgi:hypothetical protein
MTISSILYLHRRREDYPVPVDEHERYCGAGARRITVYSQPRRQEDAGGNELEVIKRSAPIVVRHGT